MASERRELEPDEVRIESRNADIVVTDEATARAAREILQAKQVFDVPSGDHSDIPEGEATEEGDEESWVCEVCGRDFDTKRGKNIHKGKAHGDSEPPDEDEDLPVIEPPELDLEEYGDWEITDLDVVEALSGVESVEAFEERLGLGSDESASLLQDLGVFELLTNGTEPIDHDRASTLVEEAVV